MRKNDRIAHEGRKTRSKEKNHFLMQLFNDIAAECSKLITHKYSTSFTWGIRAFDRKFQCPIYNIYGFVRLADEIVDTFFEYDQQALLDEFVAATHKALERNFSLNPILQAFQQTVHKYNIDAQLITAFLESMRMDLSPAEYNLDLYRKYIHGSAESVGLMCLTVFCEGDKDLYRQLSPSARRLGAAFQKVNFLRDLKSDYEERGRVYFPGLSYTAFNQATKQSIERDIKADFDAAYKGIMQLPKGARLGVYTAYRYYTALFNKIKSSSPQTILSRRVRVGNDQKLLLFCSSFFKERFGME